MSENEKAKIVMMEYDGYTSADDRLFDTTSADNAKEAEIFNENYLYGPMPYIVGSGKFPVKVDEAIAVAEAGKETEIVVACEEALGPKDPKLVEIVPMKVFAKDNVMPYKDMTVYVNDRVGRVVTVTGGRVRVDFNSPLAGHDLKYKFKILEVIEDSVEKAKAIVLLNFGSNEGFEFTVTEEKVSIVLPDLVKYNKDWPTIRYRVVTDLRTVLGISTIELIEVWAVKTS